MFPFTWMFLTVLSLPNPFRLICDFWLLSSSIYSLSENQSLFVMPPWRNPSLITAIAASFIMHFVILYFKITNVSTPLNCVSWYGSLDTVLDTISWDCSGKHCFSFFVLVLPSPSQCCLAQFSQQILYTNIERAGRQNVSQLCLVL